MSREEDDKKGKKQINRCNLCNSEHYSKVYSLKEVEIVKCKKCGLVYVLNIPTDLSKYYPDDYHKCYYKEGDEKLDYGKSEGWKKRDAKTFIRKALEFDSKGKNLLEIGCAYGFYLDVAKEMGFRTTGIEISKHAAEEARKNGHKVYIGNVESLKLKEKFDVILCINTLEHMPNPLAALQEIFRILNKDGVLVLRVPNFDSLESKREREKWEEVTETPDHLFYFTPKTITFMLGKVGFKVRRIEARIFTDKFLGSKIFYPIFWLDTKFKLARGMNIIATRSVIENVERL